MVRLDGRWGLLTGDDPLVAADAAPACKGLRLIDPCFRNLESPVSRSRCSPGCPVATARVPLCVHAEELRTLWRVEPVRQSRLGYAKAEQRAGMPQAAFVRVLGAHRVPCLDLGDEQWNDELEKAAKLGRS